MTNSEDTTTGDNLSTINNSASKVTDSFSSANGGSAHHPSNQLGGGSNLKDNCSASATASSEVSRFNGSGGGGGGGGKDGDTTWAGGGGGGPIDGCDPISSVSQQQTRLDESCQQDGQDHSTCTTLQASTMSPQLPFRLICGEKLEHKCHTTEGVLALTNYRLFIQGKNTNFNIPIGVIEQVENRDIFFLHVSGKDARCIRCTFTNNETATETMKKIQTAISAMKRMEDTFAYTFYEQSKEETFAGSEEFRMQLGLDIPQFPGPKERFDMEIKRMEFNVQGPWRISDENKEYELCGSYPTHIIVPSNMTKKQLEMVACFRSARRIPAVVWRHRGNGAVISRCSQPEVGWFGWRSAEDEELVQNIVMACADNSKMSGNGMGEGGTTRQPERIKMELDNGDDSSSSDTHNGSLLSMELVPEAPNMKKLLILDARSYTTAVANRARGGGCECLEYYPRCEIQFMNLANIHSIRKSFMNVRQLCTMTSDQSNSWYSQLESCKWLQHMSGLMKAAVTVVTAIEEEGRPVMVHCSDGWDRTPQIVSLAEILLDPYYRSLEGFQVLVEREWLDFGHKFADRCGQPLGSEDANERCPVFLQWLDCLHQLIRQFPTAFEFNLTFLVKLAQHTYSNLFGTFLFNTLKERQAFGIEKLTHSVWRFLRAPANSSKFRNNLYLNCDKVLWPSCEVRELVLWSQVYLGYENPPSQTTEILNPSQESSPAPSVAADCEMSDRMAVCKSLNKSKTRSCEDLHSPYTSGLQRRQSDPNLSDSFHAGESCDDEELEDNLPIMKSTPSKNNMLGGKMDINMVNGYTADDSNTGIGRLTDFEDSDGNDDTEPNSESKSESTVVSIARLDPKSIESSTDTLIADNTVVGGGVIDIGGVNGVEVGGKKVIRVLPKTDNGRWEESCDPMVVHEGKTEFIHTTSNMANGFLENGMRSDGNDMSLKRSTHIEGHTNGDGAMNGDEGVVMSSEPSLPVHCEVCATSRRLLGDIVLSSSSVHGNGNSSSSNTNQVMTSTSSAAVIPSTAAAILVSGSGDITKISCYNTPMHSRTPSTGVPVTPDENCGQIRLVSERQLQEIALGASSCSTSIRSTFDVDGLASLHDEVQTRLNTIVFGYRSQIEILQKELQLTRDALMKQVCHKCTHHISDRPDDVVSVGDSLASAEHQSVGHESQSSEISWEAVDEKDTRPPLWLPDYAVTNCMGCEASFWLGRRKHHCRSCGKIFCADCSDQTITIPSEQFFQPVRVCGGCFQRLASHSSENVPGPNGSSMPNGNYAAATTTTAITSDDTTVLLPHQNISHCRGPLQYANQNGYDHSKLSGCFSSSSSSPPTSDSVGQQHCAYNNTTTTVPSSSSSKDINHHSNKSIQNNASTNNDLSPSPFVESCPSSASIREPNNQRNHPVQLPSKMSRNPTCKQQSNSPSCNNDLQNHHATVTKGN